MTLCKLASVAAVTFTAAFAGCETTPEQKPLRVLMIGNSFSISCMRHMPNVAKSLGLKLDITSMYIGGCSLQRHANNIVSSELDFRPYRISRNWCGKDYFRECIDNTDKSLYGSGFENLTKSNIPQMLKAGDWDVVTIQQASGSSWRPETYRPCGDLVVDTIRRLAPGAEIVLQETWSYADGESRLENWGISQDEMYEKLHGAYRDFAAVYGFRRIPMGTAVQEWRKRLPVKGADGDVIGKDRFHLSDEGEYFQALLWTGYLFNVDVMPCAYRPEWIAPERAELMKRIVNDLVRPGKR